MNQQTIPSVMKGGKEEILVNDGTALLTDWLY
jgi:hypothetical protein